MTTLRSAAAALLLLLGAGAARAQTLRSSRAELFLGEVRPGAALTNAQPLSIENLGADAVLVLPTVQAPEADGLRDGYEPAPSLSWARLSGSTPRVAPGAATSLRVDVSVPKERALAGRQFQLDVRMQARDARGGNADLRTAVLVAVGPGDPRPVPAEPEGSELVLAPALGRAEGVALGGAAVALKLANGSSRPVTVRAAAVRDWGRKPRLETGWEPAPNPRWLKSAGPVKVPAGAVADAGLRLEIPDEPRYRGRQWVFRVAVDAEGPGRKPGRTWWTLYARTAGEAPR